MHACLFCIYSYAVINMCVLLKISTTGRGRKLPSPPVDAESREQIAKVNMIGKDVHDIVSSILYTQVFYNHNCMSTINHADEVVYIIIVAINLQREERRRQAQEMLKKHRIKINTTSTDRINTGSSPSTVRLSQNYNA